ncbi:ATP-sensitive inward rectifier potassium channel 1-like [Mytilus californianus]|uniref:KCNJN n=1 Tax=Mytilus coruscus TaxID=42192 RepID=A0A6J8DM83_MYTCO|nr:ATP-sensitive inward rectifier potassium channel 1-like [Mytilus californianus]CAC5409246.1 KCNJN [Mytilus coruscus]
MSKKDENIIFSNSHNRIVSKQGSYRVKLETPRKTILKHYLRDTFTTLVDAKWRWSILLFVSGFLLTWITFAVIYLAFARSHGDLENEDAEVCVENVYDFTTALLFSVETQHTIGYGFRHVTTDCPHAVLVVFIQFILGIGVQCLTAAIVFSKLIRSKRRGDSVVFSQKACLAVVDGQWRLMVRVADFRKSKLVGVKAKGILIKRSVINNKHHLEQTFIDFVSEGGSDTLTLLWPAVIYHTINKDSPLWPPMTLRRLGGYSEIVVSLDGVIESTSRVVQTRTSYIPEEIHYGYKFQNICPQITEDGKYQCSYFEINTVSPVVTPQLRKRISVTSVSSKESMY